MDGGSAQEGVGRLWGVPLAWQGQRSGCEKTGSGLGIKISVGLPIVIQRLLFRDCQAYATPSGTG